VPGIGRWARRFCRLSEGRDCNDLGLGPPPATTSLPANSRFDPRSSLRAQIGLFGERVGTSRLVRSGSGTDVSVRADGELLIRSAFGAARPDSEGGRGVERSDGSGIVVRVEPVALGRVDASVLMSAVSKWRGMSRDSLQRAQGGARFLRRSSPERQIGGARCPLHHSSGRTSVKNRTIRVPR
jgi:hypothetical protein